MIEITRISLENEMDLILAHKQSMKIAELTGIGIAAQTAFATAVSEVCRNVIGKDTEAHLLLSVSAPKTQPKYLVAELQDDRKNYSAGKDDGFLYARRLINDITASAEGGINKTTLSVKLPNTTRIDDQVVEKWQVQLNSDPDISPYEEIKRKNRLLIDLAEKLKDSEYQYRSLTESLPIMIFTIDDHGDIQYANQWMLDYCGQSIEAINANRWRDVLHPEEYEEAWRQWDRNVHDMQTIYPRERRLKHAATGEYRWHTGISIAKTDKDGTAHWNTYMVDIQAQKTVEQALKDNKELKEIRETLEEKVELLNQSNHQLAQFAYVTSHDLQEPLRKIGFYSDYLDKKYKHLLPAEATTIFNNLITASDRMRALVQDVLAYSTINKGAFKEVDLNIVLKEALDDLQIAIEEKNATVNMQQLPIVEGNAGQLRQLFENLLSNAIKFTKEGVSPVIDISVVQKGATATITFADNGIGFDNQYIPKMFNLFQRLHTREKFGGTGIGLAICKKIAEVHNGEISAEGRPGIGASFSITIPIKKP
ncbi:MAG: PAS domain S-box protein [Bacteroidetes bacterium]|nr:PAS domain S-box protein [Bacteroidota bacterium]